MKKFKVGDRVSEEPDVDGFKYKGTVVFTGLYDGEDYFIVEYDDDLFPEAHFSQEFFTKLKNKPDLKDGDRVIQGLNKGTIVQTFKDGTIKVNYDDGTQGINHGYLFKRLKKKSKHINLQKAINALKLLSLPLEGSREDYEVDDLLEVIKNDAKLAREILREIDV
jgi:hypothetical protein